nr:hypothetical protein Iba_chr12fCG11460 [Ipomoea batatas]
MIKNVTRTGLIFKEITLTPESEEPETAVSEDSSSTAEEEEADYYVSSRPTATNYTFELSADDDAQFKNPADDEDAHFNNRVDEDARDKKVPAAFDLNELPPEEVDEQIHGGGEPPEVAAPVTTEGDEENSPLAGQYKLPVLSIIIEIVFKVGLNSYSRQRTAKAAKKQHNAENKTAVMESLIGSATPGSVYIEPPTVAKFGRRSGTLLVFQRKQLLSEAQSSGSIGCTKGPGNKIMELLLPLLARFITFGDLETLWFTKL